LRNKTQDVLWQAMAARSSQPRVAAFGCLEPSWVFYSGRSIKDFSAARPAEAAEFLANPDAFVVTTDARYEQLKAELPADVRIVARTDYFLRRKQLLLLTRGPAPSVTERPAPAHSTR